MTCYIDHVTYDVLYRARDIWRVIQSRINLLKNTVKKLICSGEQNGFEIYNFSKVFLEVLGVKLSKYLIKTFSFLEKY